MTSNKTMNQEIFGSEKFYKDFRAKVESKLGKNNWGRVYRVLCLNERKFLDLLGKEISFLDAFQEKLAENDAYLSSQDFRTFAEEFYNKNFDIDFDTAHEMRGYNFRQSFLSLETACLHAENPSDKAIALNPLSLFDDELAEIEDRYYVRRVNIIDNQCEAMEEDLKLDKDILMDMAYELTETFCNIVDERDFNDGDFVPANINTRTMREYSAAFSYDKLEKKDVAALLQKGDIDVETVISEKFKNLVGLGQVKTKLNRMFKLFVKEKRFAEKGVEISTSSTPLNFILSGNPGVGKTTVAKIMSDVLYCAGLIKNDVFISVTAPDLKADVVGRTSVRVHDLYNSAKGGVVFIDEAYALAGNNKFDDDSFAKDAVATLMTELQKGECITILAGYKKPLENFLKSNDGLRSRFPSSHQLDIQDYTHEELMQIFQLNLTRNNYKITDEAMQKMESVMVAAKRNAGFGNARDVLNYFNALREIQAGRAALDDLTITSEDIDNLIEEQVKTQQKKPIGFINSSEYL